MLNQVVFMGRLTKDPEVFESGETKISRFDIAVENNRKESDGTRGTSFYPVVCFGNVAENVIKCLKKKLMIFNKLFLFCKLSSNTLDARVCVW